MSVNIIQLVHLTNWTRVGRQRVKIAERLLVGQWQVGLGDDGTQKARQWSGGSRVDIGVRGVK